MYKTLLVNLDIRGGKPNGRRQMYRKKGGLITIMNGSPKGTTIELEKGVGVMGFV